MAPGEEPTFTWFKSGQEFDPEDRFKVLFKEEEDTLALVFQHINPEDAGLYTCVASTSTGKISCSAELSVEGGVTQLLKVEWLKVIWIQPKLQSFTSLYLNWNLWNLDWKINQKLMMTKLFPLLCFWCTFWKCISGTRASQDFGCFGRYRHFCWWLSNAGIENAWLSQAQH